MYLGSNCDFSNLKKSLTDFASVKDFKTVDTHDKITVCSEGLTMFIKEGGNGVTFRSEDYELMFKFEFYIDINSSYPNWAVELMKFAGDILKNFNGDFILEANGDLPYIMRKKEDGIVIVDDSKLGVFPFKSLGMAYKKDKLERV
jgi:hypothetical protein